MLASIFDRAIFCKNFKSVPLSKKVSLLMQYHLSLQIEWKPHALSDVSIDFFFGEKRAPYVNQNQDLTHKNSQGLVKILDNHQECNLAVHEQRNSFSEYSKTNRMQKFYTFQIYISLGLLVSAITDRFEKPKSQFMENLVEG